MIGHGDSFILRDPAGIRPAFYYKDDEVIVVASERPAIQTAFNLKLDQINILDKQLMLPTLKHKWVARLIHFKKQKND